MSVLRNIGEGLAWVGGVLCIVFGIIEVWPLILAELGALLILVALMMRVTKLEEQEARSHDSSRKE